MLRECLQGQNQVRRAVLPLRMALAKLAPSPEALTPLHAELFQACAAPALGAAACPRARPGACRFTSLLACRGPLEPQCVPHAVSAAPSGRAGIAAGAAQRSPDRARPRAGACWHAR